MSYPIESIIDFLKLSPLGCGGLSNGWHYLCEVYREDAEGTKRIEDPSAQRLLSARRPLPLSDLSDGGTRRLRYTQPWQKPTETGRLQLEEASPTMNYRFIYEKTRDGVTETETIVQTQEGFNKYNRARNSLGIFVLLEQK